MSTQLSTELNQESSDFTVSTVVRNSTAQTSMTRESKRQIIVDRKRKLEELEQKTELTDEERRLKTRLLRLEHNRLSAIKSRRNKREYQSQLKVAYERSLAQIESLIGENNQLKSLLNQAYGFERFPLTTTVLPVQTMPMSTGAVPGASSLVGGGVSAAVSGLPPVVESMPIPTVETDVPPMDNDSQEPPRKKQRTNYCDMMQKMKPPISLLPPPPQMPGSFPQLQQPLPSVAFTNPVFADAARAAGPSLAVRQAPSALGDVTNVPRMNLAPLPIETQEDNEEDKENIFSVLDLPEDPVPDNSFWQI